MRPRPAAAAATPLTAQKGRGELDALRAAFRAADVDGNGFVDRWEMRRLLRQC